MPVKPLRIEKTGDSRLNMVKGRKSRTGTPKAEATKEPATPQGIK